MAEQNEHQDKPTEKPENVDIENLAEMSEEEILAALSDESISAESTAEGETEGEGFANPLEALAAENTRQEEEIASLKDQMLRTAAEMENLRRRTQKDVADARSFSISKFAKDILGVSDNLRRAMDHVEEADKEHAALKTLLEGVELTERELQNALVKNGVKQISPDNEKFDPNFHQAMFEIPNTEVPNNTVLQVVQVGYVIGERVLRPAMVGVSKGGPKSTPPKESEES